MPFVNSPSNNEGLEEIRQQLSVTQASTVPLATLSAAHQPALAALRADFRLSPLWFLFTHVKQRGPGRETAPSALCALAPAPTHP